LLLSGCFSKLSTVDYNNEIVDHLNPTLDAMELSLDTYETTVPLTVYADSVIDMETMQTTYDDAKLWIDGIDTNLLTLQSWNGDQQTAVQTGLNDYKEAAKTYLEKYEEMLDYYGGDFASNLDNVATLDTELYDIYNEYIDVHNTLVDTLASYT
jgi:ATP/maltotriose-dependent transcriptional regulator MalT